MSHTFEQNIEDIWPWQKRWWCCWVCYVNSIGFDDGHFFHAMRWPCFFPPHDAILIIFGDILPSQSVRLFFQIIVTDYFANFFLFWGFSSFWGVLEIFGVFWWVFEGFWGFWRVFEGFLRCYGGFFGVFEVNITIVAIIFLNHQDRLICDVFWDNQ